MPGKSSNKGFKALIVNHAEKGIFGLAALVGLGALGTTRWSHYDGTPDKITNKVKESKTALEAQTWPETERQAFVLTQDQLPAQVVYDNLRREYRPESYPFPMEFSAKFVRPLYDRKEPLKEPVLARLEQPLATAGRVLVQKAPPMLASAEGATPEGGAAPAAQPMQDETPDEFRNRNQLGGAFPGAPGGAGGPAGMSTPMFTAPDLYSGPSGYAVPGADGMAGGMAGGAVMPKVEGEGHHYVAVRAVFPVKDQIRKFAEAIQRPFGEAARAFDIIDFQLERQELVSPADGKWGEWSTVDRAAAEQVLTVADGFDPEVVAGTVTNSVMTMPLPRRVFGQWVRDITHPALERFQLSDNEINEQVEYNRRLLEKYLADQKTLQPKIQRKGFSHLTFDNREVASSVFGGNSAYDTSSYMGGMPEMSAYGGAAGYGSGYQAGGMGGMAGQGFPMAANAPRAAGRGGQMTPDELAKKILSKDEKEVSKALAEFVRTRATVDGELLLFRFIDFAVEPGKTYRYRARLDLMNPNFGRQPSEANGEATVVQGETRSTKWSEVTEPAYVKPDVDYYVASVETKKTLPTAKMSMYQWDSKMGTVVQGTVETYAGQTISGSQKVDVIDPTESTFETKNYSFSSKDFVVDAAGDAKLVPTYHTDLKFTTSSGDLGLPPRVLVADAEGDLIDIDAQSAAAAEKKARNYMDAQAKAFDYLKQLADAAANTSGLEGLTGPAMPEMSMYGDMMGPGRKKNNMRKGGAGMYGGYGSGSSPGPGMYGPGGPGSAPGRRGTRGSSPP
jgi:hypothetical protein